MFNIYNIRFIDDLINKYENSCFKEKYEVIKDLNLIKSMIKGGLNEEDNMLYFYNN